MCNSVPVVFQKEFLSTENNYWNPKLILFFDLAIPCLLTNDENKNYRNSGGNFGSTFFTRAMFSCHDEFLIVIITSSQMMIYCDANRTKTIWNSWHCYKFWLAINKFQILLNSWFDILRIYISFQKKSSGVVL